MTTLDPTAFRSEQLPVEHFDRRFSDENLAFWVPRFVRLGRIDGGTRVLDVGCGTGGLARAIAESTGAPVTGIDRSPGFLERARAAAPNLGWVEGDAEALPFANGVFDRVLLSLVLHQLASPERAVAEAARVLAGDGIVLVRTIAPEDAVERVPACYFPSMAAADERRMPSLDRIAHWVAAAGLELVARERVVRNARLRLEDEEEHLRAEIAARYPFVGGRELEEGLARMRADAARGDWVDPRPTWFLLASAAAS